MMTTEDIPDFLRLTAAERRDAWERNPPRPSAQLATTQSAWAELDERRKHKSRGRVAKMKAVMADRNAAQTGKTWDTQTGQWR